MAKSLKHGSTLDSKTTSTSLVVEKSVLLLGDERNEKTGWYVAKVSSSAAVDVHEQQEHKHHRNNNNNEKKKRKRVPHPRGTLMSPIWKSESPFNCCLAVIGSTIYKIGGGKYDYHTPTSRVYEADITKMKWNRVSRMLSKRNNARAVVVDEKIYVFGGFSDLYKYKDKDSSSSNSRSRPWAEVYDPKLNLWSPLREPPSISISCLDSYRLFAVYDHNSSKKESKNKIIVGSFRSSLLLSYDLMNNTWEIIDYKFNDFTDFARPILLDNRLYWIGHRVGVYDLNLKKMYQGPILGDYDDFEPDIREYHPEDCLKYERMFVHIGGDVFCFCWLLKGCLCDQICCTKIQISKTTDKNGRIESLKALCLSTRRYWVDQKVDFLGGLLL